MSYSAHHIIEQPRPLRKAVIFILTAALGAGLLWLFLHNKFDQQLKTITELEQKIEQVKTNNQRLQKIANLSPKAKSDLAIEKETNAQLRLELEQLHKQILTQNKDILFYQSITQGNNSSKLQFKDLYLSTDETDSNTTRYRLVITQGKKITSPIQGNIKIMLNTEANGETKRLLLDEHKLNLRHVQVIEGMITLDSGTSPKTISVDLIQKKKITLSKTFDWQLTP